MDYRAVGTKRRRVVKLVVSTLSPRGWWRKPRQVRSPLIVGTSRSGTPKRCGVSANVTITLVQRHVTPRTLKWGFPGHAWKICVPVLVFMLVGLWLRPRPSSGDSPATVRFRNSPTREVRR